MEPVDLTPLKEDITKTVQNEVQKAEARLTPSAFSSFFQSGSKQRNLLLVIVVIMFILLLQQCNSRKEFEQKLAISNANIYALQDTVKLEKNKSGEAVYSKSILLAENNDLKSLNANLASEVKKQKGTVVYITKVVTEINDASKLDSVKNTVVVLPNNAYKLHWAIDTVFDEDNNRKISGECGFTVDTNSTDDSTRIKPGYTKITNDEIGMSLVTGIREKDKKLEIFVEPKFPGVIITKLDGAIVDPKKSSVLKSLFPQKRWSIGPQLGLGIGMGRGLDASTFKPVSTIGVFVYVGIGVQYTLIRF